MNDPILTRAESLARQLERESAHVGRTPYTLLERVLQSCAQRLREAIEDEQLCLDYDNRDVDLSREIWPEGHYQC